MIDDQHSISSGEENNEELHDFCEECREENIVPLSPIPSDNGQRYVIDGSYLLTRVFWDQDVTFKEIIRKSQSHVGSRYGQCTIVFNGYQDGPSTEDHEHFQSNLKSAVLVDVSVHLDNSIAIVSQKSFLVNPNSKESFNGLFAQTLGSDSHDVIRYQGDTATAMVSSILDIACTDCNVALICADNDLLIMLLYFWNYWDTRGRFKMSGKCQTSQVISLSTLHSFMRLEIVMPLRLYSVKARYQY